MRTNYSNLNINFSLETTDDPKNNIGFFSVLPDELIVSILELLEDRELKEGISAVSHFFWDTCNKRFFDTVYGRSLRFSEWQYREIKQFAAGIQQFKENYQISFFRPNNRGFDENIFHYVKVASMLFLFTSAIAYSLVLIISLMQSAGPISSIICSIFNVLLHLTFGYGYLTNAIHNTQIQNANLLQSRASQKQVSAFNELRQSNKIFSTIPVDQLFRNSPTLLQLLTFLEQALSNVEKLAHDLDSYLKSKKSSAKRYLDEDDFEKLAKINESLPHYAKTASGLWYKNNPKKNSLIKVEDSAEEAIQNTDLTNVV